MKNYKIIIPKTLKDPPKDYELSAAKILAEYFDAEVKFLEASLIHRADILIKGIEWEIKSPTGNGKYNIQHQLQRAFRQSPYIILDCRRSKMSMGKIISILKNEEKRIKRMHQILVITKSGRVVDLKEKV